MLNAKKTTTTKTKSRSKPLPEAPVQSQDASHKYPFRIFSWLAREDFGLFKNQKSSGSRRREDWKWVFVGGALAANPSFSSVRNADLRASAGAKERDPSKPEENEP